MFKKILGNFLSMLTRRISSQINQLHILLITVLGGRIPQSPGQQAGLIRDEFGLHKIIVVATKSGKVKLTHCLTSVNLSMYFF